MTQPTPAPPQATGKRFFALQDDEDPTPYALAALNADGMPERFVPGKGFVDWPSLAGALLGFDPAEAREATEISEEQANALMAQNVGPLPDDYVAAMQGQPDGNPNAEPPDPDDALSPDGSAAPPADAAPADTPPTDAAPPADAPPSA